MVFTTGVRIEKGKMTVRNRQRMLDIVARARDGEYILTLERAHGTRSKAQNDYLWAVVNARVAEWMAEPMGRPVSPTEAHEILKATHLPHELAMSGDNGTLMNGYVIGGSTTKLNKLQFVEYLESIVTHYAERGLFIPDPDPNWRRAAEEERRRKIRSQVRNEIDHREASYAT